MFISGVYSAACLNFYFVFCEYFLCPPTHMSFDFYCTIMHMHIYTFIPITYLDFVIMFVAVQKSL